jgi:hypothetical protein
LIKSTITVQIAVIEPVAAIVAVIKAAAVGFINKGSKDVEPTYCPCAFGANQEDERQYAKNIRGKTYSSEH